MTSTSAHGCTTGSRRGTRRVAIQIPRNQPELLQRRLKVIDDLLRDHLGRGQVVAVGQALVLEPEDVEAGLVAPAGAMRPNLGYAEVSLRRNFVLAGQPFVCAVDAPAAVGT